MAAISSCCAGVRFIVETVNITAAYHPVVQDIIRLEKVNDMYVTSEKRRLQVFWYSKFLCAKHYLNTFQFALTALSLYYIHT